MVLVVFISGAGMLGLAAGASRQARTTQAAASRQARTTQLAARALEPGFTGTFQYRNDNFRTRQNLAETVHSISLSGTGP
jgi:hypothetical protein